MQDILYSISNLKQEYAKKQVLDISNLHVRKGEILALIGSNGSGKSTLLRHLAFLEKPKNGILTYKNYPYTNLPLHIKREISILLPEPYLLKRSVKENLLFGLKIRGNKDDNKKLIEEVMSLVGLMPSKFLHRNWFELSSGEKQRVCFASKLILKPEVMLLDEPTNSLDFNGIPLFSEAIKYAFSNWNTTIIIASHDLPWISNLATRKIGLHFGKLIEFSTTNILLGKWEKSQNTIIYSFDNDQKIILKADRNFHEKKGVAINPKKIEISSKKNSYMQEITLNAKVKEVLLLEKSNEISIKVSINSHTIEVIKNFEEYQKDRLFPTQNVFINFKEKDIVEI